MIKMDKKTISVFFMLLRSAITEKSLTDEEKAECLEADFESMFGFAVSQDMGHLIGEALGQNKITIEQELGEAFRAKAFRAMFRYDTIIADYENICSIFEDEKIAFIPLKGSVIRDFYIKPWLRTSCDIDILVRPEIVDEATQVLVEKAGYTKRFKGTHNVSLFSPNGVHIELHFRLMEKGLANNASSVLEDVWETALVKDGYEYWMSMPDELFYFYHVAHMAKHFENGGCGIRPFLDLWILNRMDFGGTKKTDLLKKGGLEKFSEIASYLSCVWLEGKSHNKVSEKMQQYIFSGGLYGVDENRIALKQQQKGGKVRYAISKIFIPYDEIKYHYPILQKYSWLTPVMEVRRWGKLIFYGHLGRTTKELAYNDNLSSEQADNMKVFLKDIGLL